MSITELKIVERGKVHEDVYSLVEWLLREAKKEDFVGCGVFIARKKSVSADFVETVKGHATMLTRAARFLWTDVCDAFD